MRDPPQDFSRYTSLNASAEAEMMPDPPSVSSKTKTTINSADKYTVEPSTYSPTIFSGNGSTTYVSEEPTATLDYTTQYETTVLTRTEASASQWQSTTKSSRSSSIEGSTARSNVTPMTRNQQWMMTAATPSPRTPKSVHFTDSPNNLSKTIGTPTTRTSPRTFTTHDWLTNNDELSAMTETPRLYPGGLTKHDSALHQASKGILNTSNKDYQSPSKVSAQEMTTTTTTIKSPELKRPQPDTDIPTRPFSVFSCGTTAHIIEEPQPLPPPTPTHPYGFACGLIEEEVSLLNQSQKNKTELLSKSPRSPTQGLIEDPVHASWVQKQTHHYASKSKAPSSQTTMSSVHSSVSPPPVPPQVVQSAVAHMSNPGPPSFEDYGQAFEYNPLRQTEDAVREMLNQVKRERQKKRVEKSASQSSSKVQPSSVSSRLPDSTASNPVPMKQKLEPEEVLSQPQTQKLHPPAKYKKSSKPTTPTESKKVTAAASDKSTQIENGPSPTKKPLEKSTMVLTQKTQVDTSFFDNFFPRPKSTTAARDVPKTNVKDDDLKPTDLWKDARRQRYDDLKGRIQPALSATMKISPSMQVESSSTDGSFFSFSTMEEQENKAKKAAKANQTSRSSPRLPPRHDVTPRSEFWGSGNRGSNDISRVSTNNRDRIEESRDGRDDDGENDLGQHFEARHPPESIHMSSDQGDIDRIESLRGSPTEEAVSQFRHILGIPSLDSKHSPDYKAGVLPRVTKTDFAANFSQQRQKHLGAPARAASAPRPRILPMTSEFTRKHGAQTPDNKRHTTPHKKSPPVTSSPGTPKLDQRTVRLLYAHEFSDMVRAHSQHHVEKILSENVVEKTSNSGVQTGLAFVIRKRGLLEDEEENGDFDVVETPAAHEDAVVLYEASILPDRRTRDLKAHLFRFDAVFSDDVSEDDSYLRLGQPFVLNALAGGNGTFILLGGSRSGKSHMISELEERAASDIFSGTSYGVPNVSVRCLDLYGHQCVDLLGPLGTFVKVVESNGTYDCKGAVTSMVSSPHELLTLLDSAKRRFTTQSIVRRRSNAHSYYLCEIVIESDSLAPGCLTFVECPYGDVSDESTNRKEESPFEDLMENIRSKVSRKELTPKCNLTKLLHPKLQSEHSETCVVGTVSPGSLDTETTLSTLLSIKNAMKGTSSDTGRIHGNTATSNEQNIRSPVEKIVTMPRAWTKEAMLSWMERKNFLVSGKKQNLSSASEEELSGRAVMRMTKMQLKRAFYDGLEDGEKRAEKLFIALRAENDRVGRQRVKQRRAREKSGPGSYTP